MVTHLDKIKKEKKERKNKEGTCGKEEGRRKFPTLIKLDQIRWGEKEEGGKEKERKEKKEKERKGKKGKKGSHFPSFFLSMGGEEKKESGVRSSMTGQKHGV